MREIPVSRGMVAIVDDCDYPHLSTLRWFVHASGSGRAFYAVNTRDYRRTTMHSMIVQPPRGMVVDHANGNGLDNRRSNLRVATIGQNNVNSTGWRRRCSRFKGVYRSLSNWRVMLTVPGGRIVYLGSFADEEDAARVYDSAAASAWGEFARLNFP